ncbi:MAG: efflux RND transporter periplasmic adaptor subunit [Verrucomicrobiia bacterium]|jgi:HlyD family secretion protein
MKTELKDKSASLLRTIKVSGEKALAFLIPFAKRKPILSSVIGVALVVIFFSMLKGGGSGQDGLSYFKVVRGNFLVSIVEGGTLQAVNEVTVRNEVDGNSRIIYIMPEGTIVKKGELVVELDTEEAEKELNEQLIRYEDDNADFIKSETDVVITQSTVESEMRKAELDVQFAQMDLEKFEQIEKEQEMRNAQIEIITAQESLKIAEERLEWSEKLTQEGFETKSNLDRDKLSVTNQSLGLEKAESVRKMLNEFDLTKMEAEYRSVLEESNKELERVEKQGESKILQANTQRDIDKRKLGLSKTKLAKMHEQMAATKLYAPQDGLLVYAINENRFSSESIIEEGAMIRQRQAIVKIPDTSKMKVDIKVHESHVNQVKVGQKAFIVLDSLPDDRFVGEVVKIAVLPDAQSRFGNSNLKVYATEIVVQDMLPDVKPGVSARAEIVIENLQKVLTVPIQCVTTVKGKQVCYVKGIGGPKPVPVKIGMFNNKFIEIKSGLKSGDRVLLAPPIDSSIDLGGSLIYGDEEVDMKPSENVSQPDRDQPKEPSQKPERNQKRSRERSDN